MNIVKLSQLAKAWVSVGNDLCYALGAEIFWLRRKLGWTQEETAQKAGNSVDKLQALEYSDITLDIKTYLGVMSLLNKAVKKQ